MRYLIDLYRTADDGVEGALRREDELQAVAFSGWMELMSLLEPPPLEPPPIDAAGARRVAAAEGRPLAGPF